MILNDLRLPSALLAVAVLSACVRPPDTNALPNRFGEGAADVEAVPAAVEQSSVTAEQRAMYNAVEDDGIPIPAVPARFLNSETVRQEVNYWSSEAPGTIIVDPHARYLYQIKPDNRAMRYTVAVGAAGYGWTGEAHVPYKRDWPHWTPTQNMIKREPDLYGPIRDGLDGGIENPLGARALYLHDESGDTLYRIHGTPEPESIGHGTSSGCIRLFNQDIIHLASKTDSMTKVMVLTEAQSGRGTVPPLAEAADVRKQSKGEAT
ncbi:L,D-transpeptidase [Salipiger mangrovisoli]|uniref:L,D-transpeptidase n=1 Tax=Salipiger mangrovisoli TaxID=2865933 RepID=A0ABR9X6T0_9RHOB|nr:L,D-transpeptidase [Salipiger mangrovisoli]MBE9639248.1 L,D-transpeptidase [Salipiger mangrovisoli]